MALTLAPHPGSRACYQRGCRQADCVEANRVSPREIRAGHRGTPTTRMGAFELGRPA